MMNVEGVKISAETLVSVCCEMQKHSYFTYIEVQGSLIRNGVDQDVAYRAADRWLQKMKRQGSIAYRSKKWGWIRDGSN